MQFRFRYSPQYMSTSPRHLAIRGSPAFAEHVIVFLRKVFHGWNFVGKVIRRRRIGSKAGKFVRASIAAGASACRAAALSTRVISITRCVFALPLRMIAITRRKLALPYIRTALPPRVFTLLRINAALSCAARRRALFLFAAVAFADRLGFCQDPAEVVDDKALRVIRRTSPALPLS